MTARKRTISKRAKPDEIAMTAADNLLTIVTELHIAFRTMKPAKLTTGQQNVVLGHLQQASDVVPTILWALGAMGAAIGIGLVTEEAAA